MDDFIKEDDIKAVIRQYLKAHLGGSWHVLCSFRDYSEKICQLHPRSKRISLCTVIITLSDNIILHATIMFHSNKAAISPGAVVHSNDFHFSVPLSDPNSLQNFVAQLRAHLPTAKKQSKPLKPAKQCTTST